MNTNSTYRVIHLLSVRTSHFMHEKSEADGGEATCWEVAEPAPPQPLPFNRAHSTEQGIFMQCAM